MQLTDVLHFRGETVTLYATFKGVDSTPESTGLTVLNPTVKIEYVNNAKQVVTVLSERSMITISKERFYYRWKIADNAPYTTYLYTCTGIIDSKVVSHTEEIIVANPAVTLAGNRKYLRYGTASYLVRTPITEPRRHPSLPKGTF